MPSFVLIVAALLLAPVPFAAARDVGPPKPPERRATPVRTVLLRPTQIDGAALLEALQLRSPQRTLALPPWPDDPATRSALFAVVTASFAADAVALTVVLSDGRAYYRTLEASADDAPRIAASATSNLLAAIEEDQLPPDEEDVPLPAEQEPAAEPPPEPEPAPEPAPAPEPVQARPSAPAPVPSLAPEPLELEAVAGGTLGAALGPPSPTGFVGGGGLVGLELRWPTGPLASLAVRSHWHRPEPLTVGRTRISLGGGYALRRGRFELRATLALDLEPWGTRRNDGLVSVTDPSGRRRERGMQLGGHLRLSPSLRLPLRSKLALRVGPRVELAGGALAQGPGIARLLVARSTGAPAVVTRVGGLELFAGLELGLGWTLPTGARRDRP